MTDPAENDARPCAACPWVSRDDRDRSAVSDPRMQAAMEAGAWFCCHVDLGTCHGARLLHERHVRKSQTSIIPPAVPAEPDAGDVETLADLFEDRAVEHMAYDDMARLVLASDWLAAHDAEARRAAGEQIAQAIRAGRTSRPVGVSPTEHAASIAVEVTS